MPKSTTYYVCQNCGESFPKWSGQCPNCGEWNTLVETLKPEKTSSVHHAETKAKAFDATTIIHYGQVQATAHEQPRISTGIGEFDRVLGSDRFGSGIVPGAVMLIGGEPGIGKSTLLTQLIVQLLQKSQKNVELAKQLSGPILYLCGEESPSQIALRIKRILENEHISLKSEILHEKLRFVTSTDVDQLLSTIDHEQPSVVIVDSIQTLTTDDLIGSAGSVGQLREVTDRLTQVVKQRNIPTFLVGHVTKEGTIAGPKVLEHIVDAVLELSGERTGQLRLLRAIKNRFGATDEVGVFQITEYGLDEVANPSDIFLETTQKNMTGAATVCVMEGTRPLLVEMQALVVESQLAMPRRVGRGVQLSRIQVLAAVLQKYCHFPLGSSDIFVNVAGGFTITEPAVDLGLAVAMVSSYRNIALPTKSVFIGEVGLLGEIRNVSYLERRIKEAKRLGFTHIYSRETHRTILDLLKELKLSTSDKQPSFIVNNPFH